MIKRFFDVFVSLICLFLLSPVLFCTAVIVYRNLGAPVIFRQTRPGKDGKPFQILKFRTMQNSTDFLGTQLPDQERITTVGSFLRKTSLDELPQLWNVLKGDMSFVGPRPLRMEYLSLYSREQFRRHETRPGITGWAQVNGRNAIDWEKKFELDIWYLHNQNLWTDLKIIFLTLKIVIARYGVTVDGENSMSKFTGNKE